MERTEEVQELLVKTAKELKGSARRLSTKNKKAWEAIYDDAGSFNTRKKYQANSTLRHS